MNLRAHLKFLPTPAQCQARLETIEHAIQACNYISQQAWELQAFRQAPLHRLVNRHVRARFGLSARVVGRERISCSSSAAQLEMLRNRQGRSDLSCVEGRFYLLATCDAEVRWVRGANLRLRTRLPRNGCRGTRRRLAGRSRKDRRFATPTNHGISKQLVEKTQRNRKGIALEDLQGIRRRARASRMQQSNLHSWAFPQLSRLIEYAEQAPTARRAGVKVKLVDPRQPAQECSQCGHVSKGNRKSRHAFECELCGYAAPADFNTAYHIAGRAAVNQPDYSLPSTAG